MASVFFFLIMIFLTCAHSRIVKLIENLDAAKFCNVSWYQKNRCTVNSISIFSFGVTQTISSCLAFQIKKLKKKRVTSVERVIRFDNASQSDIHGYSSLTFAVSRINTP